MVTRLSTAAISRSNGNVPSIDPSSTSTISKVSPLASITDLSRAYRSVTFSCSLWSGTTIEYLSTVFFIIRERSVASSDFREAEPHSEASSVPGLCCHLCCGQCSDLCCDLCCDLWTDRRAILARFFSQEWDSTTADSAG